VTPLGRRFHVETDSSEHVRSTKLTVKLPLNLLYAEALSADSLVIASIRKMLEKIQLYSSDCRILERYLACSHENYYQIIWNKFQG
jgi:hypothetical protein